MQRRGPGLGVLDISRGAVLQPGPSVSHDLLLLQMFSSLQVHAWIHKQQEEGEVLTSTSETSWAGCKRGPQRYA